MSRASRDELAKGVVSGLNSALGVYSQKKIEEQALATAEDPNATPVQQAIALAKIHPSLGEQRLKQASQQQQIANIVQKYPGAFEPGFTPGAPSQASRNAVESNNFQPQFVNSPQVPQNSASVPEIIPNQQLPQPQPNIPVDSKQKEQQKLQAARELAGISPPMANQLATEAKELAKDRRAERKFEQDIVKSTQAYADEVLDNYKASKTTDAVLNQMLNLGETGNLSEPLMISSLNAIGLPIGVLNNPDTEEYDKLANTLTRDVTEYYGGRVPVTEFQNFLKQLPGLMNSVEGRKRVTENLQRMLLPKKIEYDIYKQIMKENGGKRPMDIKEQVFERMEPLLDKWADDFNKDMKKVNPSQVPSGSFVLITPSGDRVYVPKDKVAEALSQGGRLE